MPELPEVETMVRGVRPYLTGHTLRRITACPCPCRPLTIKPGLKQLKSKIEGQVITQIRRRAKRAIFEFESGEALVIEPRMTGLLLISDPPDPGHLRLEFQVESSTGQTHSVWFWDRRGLGTVTLFSPLDYQTLLTEGQLGRDALEMTIDRWQTILSSTRREIKVALLDQKLVAGIGNLYASEILHRAGIHPQARASELKAAQIEALALITREVLEEAIRYEGSTLSDGTYRNALNQSGGYQNAHRVYDRAGETCPSCGQSEVIRIVQAQRSTFFCTRCQPQRKSRSR